MERHKSKSTGRRLEVLQEEQPRTGSRDRLEGCTCEDNEAAKPPEHRARVSKGPEFRKEHRVNATEPQANFVPCDT